MQRGTKLIVDIFKTFGNNDKDILGSHGKTNKRVFMLQRNIRDR
jgi:hypothetical protein